MRKDYVSIEGQSGDETAFVEEYWTRVWDREGGPKGAIGRIPSKDEYRVIAPYLKALPSGAKILDGGCGLGDWVLALAGQGFDVTGLDLSRKTVARLQALFPQARFMAGDVRSTGYPDGEVDAYYSWGVFEHFENGLQDCVREAFRILKPGGMLFVSVPLDNLRHAVLGNFARPQATGSGMRFYQWRLTRAELAREMAIGGFDVLEVRPIHKRQGVLRSLHHEMGLPYDWLLTKGLSVLLAPLIPSSFIAHMVLAVARKPLSRGSSPD